MTSVEIQYKVEQTKEALDKCFEFLGKDKPNFIEEDYWLTNALAELNEVRKTLSGLADAEEKELGESARGSWICQKPSVHTRTLRK